MKLITFLGTGNYQSVTYHLREDRYAPGKYVQKALAHFLRPDEIVVLVTKEAEEKHRQSLQAELEAAGMTPESISWKPIPVGKEEKDLWEIFEKLAESLQTDVKVCFDITHSFRSQPFLVLLASAYLRVAKSVEITGIYYGAFEAKEPPSAANETQPTDLAPIFDLTPFLTLLDWTNATDQFLQTGDGSRIGALLENKHRDLRKRQTPDGDESMPFELQNLGIKIQKVSEALELMQPRSVLPYSHQLIEQLKRAKPETDKWAHPFSLLLEKIRLDFEPIACPSDESKLEDHLKGQWMLIQRYFRLNRTVQAVSLSREWIVSIVCMEMNIRNWINTDERKKAEGEIYNKISEFNSADYRQDPGILVSVWKSLTDFRNQIDHCGMKTEAISPDKLTKNVMNLLPELRKIAIEYSLELEKDTTNHEEL